ncbi:glycosyltransferase [Nocardioides zeae]|uniref:Glycosyltransferase n=1 Tax=Nocardioides zeae TaxID=1457234 RepID=A0A6P0HP16_9ACTN|nr:glycosyltransferase [Nocardioides zeae]NEN79977.1 glycosyltransferase [Nocardioides zeae]
MRILQVLTYISADGAYGGPVAVARAQCAELAARGHEVQLVTAWDEQADPTVPGVRVRPHRAARLPGLGFAGLTSPGAWADVRRLARDADVVHLHYARDFVQMPSAASIPRRTPTVLQVHGMVRPDARATARLLDALFVRPAYRRASAHLCLTDDEEAALSDLGPVGGIVARIRNGVPLTATAATWSSRPRIVFLARLHERKRPLAFVEMAARMIADGSPARFDLYGPDEGEGSRVRELIASSGLEERVAYHGAVDPREVATILASAQAYVLPSVREVFPMALLEAMAAGVPSILTDDCGLSDELRSRGTAAVTDGSPAQLADAAARLTNDEATWTEASLRSRADVAAHFSPASVVDRLERIYQEVVRP